MDLAFISLLHDWMSTYPKQSLIMNAALEILTPLLITFFSAALICSAVCLAMVVRHGIAREKTKLHYWGRNLIVSLAVLYLTFLFLSTATRILAQSVLHAIRPVG